MPNWDTFYNKKRNFPEAEERKYDDIKSVDIVLTRSYKVVGIRYNYYPKYPILTLELIAGFHDAHAYQFAHNKYPYKYT